MGLSGSLGNQGYSCESCGHSMTLYAPHCPVCLNKMLSKPQNTKVAGPTRQASNDTGEIGEQKGSSIPFGLLVAVLAAAVGAYVMFGPKQVPNGAGESTARPDVSSSSKRVTNPISRPSRPRKSIKQPSVVQASRTPSVSTSRRVAPMKLWEADNE